MIRSSRRTLLTGALSAALLTPGLKAVAKTAWPAELTDVLGRKVTIARRPQRLIVSDYIANFLIVGGSAALPLVAALARDHWETARTGEYRVLTEAFPALKTLPSIGGYHDNLLNTEKILSLKPDVVITSIAKYRDNAARMSLFESAGIAVVVVDYHAMTTRNHALSTRLIGALAGAKDRAEALIAEMTAGLADVDRRIAALPDASKHRPTYLETGSKGVGDIGNSYNKTVLWGAMLERIGADNLAADNRTPWGALTREFVIRRQPQIIFMAGSLWTKGAADQMTMGFTVKPEDARRRLAAFARRKEWETLPAVKNHRIYGVDHGSLRSIIDWRFTEFLAKVEYPQAFLDCDPQKGLLDAYRRYLPEIHPEGTFMIALDDSTLR